MAITTAVAELLKSFYELLVSVLGTAYAVVHGIFMTIFNFAHGLFTLAGDILGGIFNITSGVGKFVLSMFSSCPEIKPKLMTFSKRQHRCRLDWCPHRFRLYAIYCSGAKSSYWKEDELVGVGRSMVEGVRCSTIDFVKAGDPFGA